MLRQQLRLQLQETDSLFQSTKAQQDEYLKKIASLESERDRLKEQVAELEETARDLYTHLSTSRHDDSQLECSLPYLTPTFHRSLSENPELMGAQIVVQPPSPRPRQQQRGGAAQGRR
jgi:chromosome segregation ATPase